MGGFEVPLAPTGWGVERGCGRGYPLPTGGKGLGRGLCPSPENFSYFWLKIPHFDAL